MLRISLDVREALSFAGSRLPAQLFLAISMTVGIFIALLLLVYVHKKAPAVETCTYTPIHEL